MATRGERERETRIIQAIVKALDDCDKLQNGNFLKARAIYKEVLKKELEEVRSEFELMSLACTDVAN